MRARVGLVAPDPAELEPAAAPALASDRGARQGRYQKVLHADARIKALHYGGRGNCLSSNFSRPSPGTSVIVASRRVRSVRGATRDVGRHLRRLRELDAGWGRMVPPREAAAAARKRVDEVHRDVARDALVETTRAGRVIA